MTIMTIMAFSKTYPGQYKAHESLRAIFITCLMFVSIVAHAEVPTAESLTSEQHSDVTLTQTGAGSYTVNVLINGLAADFLLDTGASMVTVSAALFDQLQEHTKMTRVKRIGARLASGKVEILDVYRAYSFSLDNHCELGPIEIAVLEQGGRNLLGMNALQQAAPLSLSFTPPALGLSHCMHR